MSTEKKPMGRKPRGKESERSRLDELEERRKSLYDAMNEINTWTQDWRDKGHLKVISAIQKISQDACVNDMLFEADEVFDPAEVAAPKSDEQYPDFK